MKTKFFDKVLRSIFIFVFVVGATTMPGREFTVQAAGNDVLYTTDADFDQGTLVSVNHDAPNNNQLQLDSPTEPFPFINVAASGRGTMVRANTETGEIVGEYRTAPEGRGLNPSRTTVDLFGNVWTANRDEVGEIDGILYGSAVKIGLIVGGTRVNEDGSPNPDGEYLAPPFDYNTCSDRNGDGLIRTSKGLGNILDWPDTTDGLGGVNGLVEDAVDECILIYQRLPDAEQARHVSVDADNNVWVGGYPFVQRKFHKLDGATGAILDSFDTRDIGCGGYGGLVDGDGILWSVGGALLRYDPVARTGMCIQQYGYGLGIDTNGYIWMSLWDGGIVKVAPDGTVVPGFPKATFPPSLTTTSLSTGETDNLMAALTQQAITTSAHDASTSPEAAEDTHAPSFHPQPHASSMKEPVSNAFGRDRGLDVFPQNEAQALNSPLAGDPSFTFQVAPVDYWISSFSAWTPGSTITLTIEDGGSVVYSDSQVADSNGNFNFNLWEGGFTLQRGQVVTVSDGTTTKNHTVMPLYVDGVNITDDTVFGRADASATVEVWVHQGGWLSVTPDASGNWTADFTDQIDLTYTNDGGSRQTDDDGDSTGVWWASPRIQVAPENDWVQSSGNWTVGTTVTLTVADGGGVLYSDSQAVDSNGHFNFNLWNVFDIQRGYVVTVFDGTFTKTHTVMPLYVDGVDVDADTVFGRGEAGSNVHVWVHGDGGTNAMPDGSGNWTADFSGQTDLTYLSDGGSQQSDEDGDSTGVWWASPSFQVAPDNDWVQSRNRWTPGSTITLTIEDGGVVVYSDSQVADPYGNFNFNLWEVFNLQRGQEVTVSDGANTKTHVVMPLYVDGVDVDAETIVGRADPAGSDVNIWVHGDGDLNVTPDGSGNWTADFSGQTDLTYLSDGGSQQFDDDGDSTGVWWASPRFWVAPDDNWVQSRSRWTPGSTITLTITDGGSLVYSDSQVVNSNGSFNFNLWESGFDLQRGQEVTVSDGATTKTHTVMPFFLDGVNVTDDTIFGRADAGTDVEVWVHNDGNVNVTADGSGNWIADFTGQIDITYTNDGASAQYDDDGDGTGVWWAGPRFWAAPQDDWVGSMRPWSAGATISLTIEEGGGVVHTDSQVTDSSGNFNFNLGGIFDLQPGQVVTVSDGTAIKTHTVTPLYVDGVDITDDTISGRALAGTTVDVWVHGNGNLNVTADGSGNWVADFTSQTDITYANNGGSGQYDDDGDGTGVWWAFPSIRVNPDNEWVESRQSWTPGATITLSIEDGGSEVYSDTQTADTYGNFGFYFGGTFDLQRGQVVTVSDGTYTKTHIVQSLYVDAIDVAADTASGRADAGSSVDVWTGDGNDFQTVTADASGNWTADFSGMTDLTYLSDIHARQADDDGDVTRIDWSTPRFWVAPDDNWVQSMNRWTPGETITLTIEAGGIVVYTDSQVADSYGNFNFNLGNVFDLQRGQVVTVSDGTITKTHTVMPFFVDGVNVTDDTIFGRADAGTDVEVWVHGDGNLMVTADGSGNWIADFTDQTDITYMNDGGSAQYDDDGDGTGVWWASPTFQASPDDNWVQSRTRWTPGATITLTVEESGVVVFTDSQTVDAYGNFNFNVWGADLAVGHVVTISDGTITKTHTIVGTNVTDIDVDADRIYGNASPGAPVWVWVNLFDNGSGRSVTADASGDWMADFSVGADGQPAYDLTDITMINTNEYDDDGDSTWKRFGPQGQGSTGVAVTPLDNNVWIANRNPGTVTRLDNDGNFVAAIPTGNIPTGVAVDAAGKVWATNLGSDNVVRINPDAGLGAVDLTVDLGPGASPYNYSDMTGAVVVGSTSPQGIWTVVQDSEVAGFEWGRLLWNTEPQGSEPAGTAIIVEARSADTEAGLGGQAFQPVTNGELFSMFGRFIEVRVTLKASPEGDSPVLSDLRIQPHVIYVGIDIKPGSFPNTVNCKDKTEVISVAVLTTEDLDALTVDYTTVTFEGAKEIHVDKRTGLPVKHVEDIDLDGDMDLVFHFYVRNTTLTCGSTSGQIKGFTYDGIPIEGTDSIRMVKK